MGPSWRLPDLTNGTDEVIVLRTRRILPSLIALCLLSIVLPAETRQVALTILHTNDTHGHLLPFSYPDSAARTNELQGLAVYRNIGGVARRATLVRRIREELRQRGTPVWLVDAGDYYEGTPFSTEYRGEADVATMNAIGYDLGTLGNHEFSNTAEQLRKLVSLSKYQLVCANATDRSTGQSLTAPYVIRQLDSNLKVGVFGLTAHDGGTYLAGREGISVGDEIETAKKTVQELRAKADVVILISHAGKDLDVKMGNQIPGIDVIVGGHSHTRMALGDLIPRSSELKRSDVNGTVIVQAHQWGGEIGRLDLLFVKDEQGAWHVAQYRSRLIPITSEIPDDPGLAALVDKYWKPIEARYGEVIGQAADEFSSRLDDLGEYNLVDDALRETYGTDFAFGNMAGVRAPLLRGPITRGDLVTLDPFTNTVVTFTMTGREILSVLKRYSPTVSGIRYHMRDGELEEVTIGGKPVDENQTYKGVTNSYFSGTRLKGVKVQDTGRVRLDVLIEYIRKKGTIRPAYDGRRVIVGRAPGAYR
jgi:5'-nucleotidase / UDP-sugar diphosphatase